MSVRAPEACRCIRKHHHQGMHFPARTLATMLVVTFYRV